MCLLYISTRIQFMEEFTKETLHQSIISTLNPLIPSIIQTIHNPLHTKTKPLTITLWKNSSPPPTLTNAEFTLIRTSYILTHTHKAPTPTLDYSTELQPDTNTHTDTYTHTHTHDIKTQIDTHSFV
eukprot:GHVR01042702.1.p1 GENE.GHVR01042702.1~~GHVR01042702.1.p1  ORF type:complete len:126 (+),score=23.79 GHVR01042702.1:460-837(+)